MSWETTPSPAGQPLQGFVPVEDVVLLLPPSQGSRKQRGRIFWQEVIKQKTISKISFFSLWWFIHFF